MAVHYITWQRRDESGRSELGERSLARFRAPYDQPLKAVIEQAEHDRDVNNRVDVRIEDAKGKVVWPKGG